jgi:hypothetical protein
VVTELLYSVTPITEEVLARSRSRATIFDPSQPVELVLTTYAPVVEGTAGAVVEVPRIILSLAPQAPVVETPPTAAVAVPLTEIGWQSGDGVGLRVLGSVGTSGTIDIVAYELLFEEYVYAAGVTGS